MNAEENERCQRCGRGYALVWAAEDDLWNEVTGSGESGMLCPDCFNSESNARGIFPFFVAFREHLVIDARRGKVRPKSKRARV